MDEDGEDAAVDGQDIEEAVVERADDGAGNETEVDDDYTQTAMKQKRTADASYDEELENEPTESRPTKSRRVVSSSRERLCELWREVEALKERIRSELISIRERFEHEPFDNSRWFNDKFSEMYTCAYVRIRIVAEIVPYDGYGAWRIRPRQDDQINSVRHRLVHSAGA